MKCGLISAAAVVLLSSAAFAAAPLGDTECIQLSAIQESPAIDDRTILVKLNGTDNYKRIDLLGTLSWSQEIGQGVKVYSLG